MIALHINDRIKLLEHLKQEIRRTDSWNKQRSEITIQSKNNNLDYMNDSTFRNITRLFVLSFKNGEDDPARKSFDQYYMPLVEIGDFNGLVDNKPFFDQLVKSKQEAYEKLIEMSRNNDHTTVNLLYYMHH